MFWRSNYVNEAGIQEQNAQLTVRDSVNSSVPSKEMYRRIELKLKYTQQHFVSSFNQVENNNSILENRAMRAPTKENKTEKHGKPL